MFQPHISGKYQDIDISEWGIAETGSEVTLGSFMSIKVLPGAHLKIGNRVFINDHSTIRCTERIEIGDSTMFGDGVRIYDSNHKFSNYHVEDMRHNKGSVIIGKNCWIGANCVILKGVTIGDNVIIGANTVVYKDVPANSIVQSRQEYLIKERYQAKHHVFTFTMSDTLEQLEYLATHLPEVDFHIAAPTNVSPYLESFERFDNINLYTNVTSPLVVEQLKERADIYLDINHWGEVWGITEQMLALGKPIVGFDNVSHRQGEGCIVISHQEPEKMVATLKELLELN